MREFFIDIPDELRGRHGDLEDVLESSIFLGFLGVLRDVLPASLETTKALKWIDKANHALLTWFSTPDLGGTKFNLVHPDYVLSDEYGGYTMTSRGFLSLNL